MKEEEQPHIFTATIEVKFEIAEHGCTFEEAQEDADEEFEAAVAKIEAIDYISVKYKESPKELVTLHK